MLCPTNHYQTLAPVVTVDIIESSLLPILERLVTDDIPNIRFNVAKSYAVLISTLRRLPADKTLVEVEKSEETIAPSLQSQELIQSRVVPSLEKLQEDDDVDVRYFATTAGGNQDETMQTSP
jgi:serine/threonine-protein phosphatase 2A regulatory subunit A